MALTRAVFLLLILTVVGAACDDGGPPATLLPARQLTVEGNGHSARVTAELAVTEGQREQGLMLRQELDQDYGMLFLFPADVRGGFWMKNTYVPLTIAYLAKDGRVMELRDGVPLSEAVLTPAEPYRYVLEVNKGWFERHGLGVGSVVHLPADLPAAQ
jgi:hypothetical protein